MLLATRVLKTGILRDGSNLTESAWNCEMCVRIWPLSEFQKKNNITALRFSVLIMLEKVAVLGF